MLIFFYKRLIYIRSRKTFKPLHYLFYFEHTKTFLKKVIALHILFTKKVFAADFILAWPTTFFQYIVSRIFQYLSLFLYKEQKLYLVEIFIQPEI